MLKKIADRFIIAFLIFDILYCAYMLFVVYHFPDTKVALLDSAINIPSDYMVARRLYAIQAYVILMVLFVYLGMRKKIWDFGKQLVDSVYQDSNDLAESPITTK